MIIKLDSGKELTLEEVKEVVEKFNGMFVKKQKEYLPPVYVYPTYPVPAWPYYEYPVVTSGI